MRTGNLTKRILEHLMDATADSIYLFAAIIDSGYGASRSRIERRAWELREQGLRGPGKGDLRRKRNNFYAFLYHLEKDDLIRRQKSKWSITPLGKRKYKLLLNKETIQQKHYSKEIDTTLKIVIFDIPEKERWKRDWIRYKLLEIGFEMLQKSVWAGKVKLPSEFIEDLRILKLFPYIEIFSVTKSGSLRQ